MTQQFERESMVFYASFFEAIKDLPADQFKDCACTLLGYGLFGLVPESKGIEKTIFIMAKPQIDKNHQRWENAKKKNTSKEDGAKSEEKPTSCDVETTKEQAKELSTNVDKNVEESTSLAKREEVTVPENDVILGCVNDEESEDCPIPEGECVYSDADFVGHKMIEEKGVDVRDACGEFNNVFLSVNERGKLITQLGIEEYIARLEFFSAYLKRKPGHKSACHYVDMMDWVGKAVEERRPKKTEEKKEEKKDALEFDFENFYERP